MEKKEFATKLVLKYKNYGITRETEYWHENEINYEGKVLIIKNPHGENIRILCDGNAVSKGEIILSCSHYHTHFYDFYFPKGEEENFVDYFVEDISKLIDKILQGKGLQDVFI